MDGESQKIRVGCCQFAPYIGNVDQNIARVEAIMTNLNPGDVDLLVLPEMAFSGYVFRDKESIQPIVEDSQTGPTVTWAKATAQRLRCHVIVGYPRVEQGKTKSGDKYYNSLCFVAPDGTLLHTYDKRFLYEVDENWAEEGKNFCTIETEAFGKIGLGICMDINPKKFEAPFEAYEWATFLHEERVDVAILIAAWLDANVESEDSLQTPNYWAHRMKPLINTDSHFVVCNRTGTEDGVTFTGCSCVMSLREPVLLAQLNKRQENVLLVELDRSPRRR
eukprot:comp29548_c0_seq1/m.47226 comp29548_c0_seq1/g.47226  ORF comp29548_c0_seq1/g.47226 comp29548_c0_seq1/m.47226 type:complete len:277 (-) comp29548_c0_seq1:93-923(-)